MGKKKRQSRAWVDDEPAAESPFASLRNLLPADDENDVAVQQGPPQAARLSGDRAAGQGKGVVRVQRERKGRRGKTVSVITGIAGSEAARLDVLKQLKQKLGTGGTLKEDAIEIQGDHRERIVELLNAMGYRAKQAGG